MPVSFGSSIVDSRKKRAGCIDVFNIEEAM